MIAEQNMFDEHRRIVIYLDGLQAKVNALRELQSETQEELSALLPSVLDKAYILPFTKSSLKN